ncbi:MAG: hypothetical protein J6W37_04745 [Bacteroidales bacterium]|nr:hypothetical protein [Bacteroidales bacterium]
MMKQTDFRSKILLLILFVVHINTFAQQTTVRITFKQNCLQLISNQLIDTPVVLNKFIYQNECGTKYQINQIQYFISDIELHVNGEWIGNPEVCFGNPRLFVNNCCYIDCENEPIGLQFTIKKNKISIDSIRFVFGIPKDKNIPYSFSNPELARMYWPEALGGGYHYMKTNIKFIDKQDSVSLFNCHLGRGVGNDTFIDNDFAMTFPCKLTFNSKKATPYFYPRIDIIMHVEKWFSQPNKIDFNLYTKGIMGKQDIMSQLCENGKNVFEVDPYLWYEVSQF